MSRCTDSTLFSESRARATLIILTRQCAINLIRRIAKTLSSAILAPIRIPQTTMSLATVTNCWPGDYGMRLIKHHVNLGRTVFWNMKQSLPRSLTTLNGRTHSSLAACIRRTILSFCSVSMSRICQNQDDGREQFSLKDADWNLTNEQTKERTAEVFPPVSDDG
jgi:hypothetical protein